MKKYKTVSKLKKELWTLFSLYIRTRDCIRTTGCPVWGLCITCGKRYHIKLLQAGHFIPGRHNANLFYERGTHAQCYNCNINLKGNTLEYMDALKDLYGGRIIDELREYAKLKLQYKPHDIEAIKEIYKQKLKELR